MFSHTFRKAAAGSLAALALSTVSLTLVATPVRATAAGQAWQNDDGSATRPA